MESRKMAQGSNGDIENLPVDAAGEGEGGTNWDSGMET